MTDRELIGALIIIIVTIIGELFFVLKSTLPLLLTLLTSIGILIGVLAVIWLYDNYRYNQRYEVNDPPKA